MAFRNILWNRRSGFGNAINLFFIVLCLLISSNVCQGFDCIDFRVIPSFTQKKLFMEGIINRRNPNPGMGKRDRLKSFFSTGAASQSFELSVFEKKWEIKTDQNGFFSFPVSNFRNNGEVTLSDKSTGKVFFRQTFSLVESPGYLMVSDVDDTILVSHVKNKVSLVFRTMFSSVGSRKPVLGTPEIYRDLAKGNSNQKPLIFYLSSSPSSLEKFLESFLQKNLFPPGILCLKESLWKAGLLSRIHKLSWLKRIKNLNCGLKWLLLGDSGEQDPEIYLEFIESEKAPAIAVVIRLVEGTNRSGKQWEDLRKKAVTLKTQLILWKEPETLRLELEKLKLLESSSTTNR